MKSMNVKAMIAAAGAGALLAMGGVTVATSSADPEIEVPGPVDAPEANIGGSTEDTPTFIPSAAPEIKGPAELPPEEQGLPG